MLELKTPDFGDFKRSISSAAGYGGCSILETTTSWDFHTLQCQEFIENGVMSKKQPIRYISLTENTVLMSELRREWPVLLNWSEVQK